MEVSLKRKAIAIMTSDGVIRGDSSDVASGQERLAEIVSRSIVLIVRVSS